jgi:hypothetical protein
MSSGHSDRWLRNGRNGCECCSYPCPCLVYALTASRVIDLISVFRGPCISIGASRVYRACAVSVLEDRQPPTHSLEGFERGRWWDAMTSGSREVDDAEHSSSKYGK